MSCLGTQLEAKGALITVKTAGPMTGWASENLEGKMSSLQEHSEKINETFEIFFFFLMVQAILQFAEFFWKNKNIRFQAGCRILPIYAMSFQTLITSCH